MILWFLIMCDDMVMWCNDNDDDDDALYAYIVFILMYE